MRLTRWFHTSTRHVTPDHTPITARYLTHARRAVSLLALGLLAASPGMSGCVDAETEAYHDAAPDAALRQVQQRVESETLPWLDPENPRGVCTDVYPPCQVMCDPQEPHPGTPGYCCASQLERSTCEAQGIYHGEADSDGDGVPNSLDNCPRRPNPDQANADGDQWGDACDNCPNTPSPDLSDHDGDGIGSVCDDDDDNDGILDVNDLCPTLPLPQPPYSTAPHYNDNDGDGMGDACDPDDDNDGVRDIEDNCDFVPNPLQSDYDHDQIGDRCDSDITVDSVLLRRVRHTNKFDPGTVLTHPQYQPWEDAGVSGAIQQNTYLAHYREPPRDEVEHLVFVTAGQQGFWVVSQDGTTSSQLTGQGTAYKNFPDYQGTRNVAVNNSLVRELIRGRHVTAANTSILGAFDARFNWEHTWWTKDNIEEAYYRWLESKFDPANIRSIFLAGHSRGGCLVARLAARFQQDYPNVPLIVQLYDPVCNHQQFELGVDDLFPTANPLDNTMLAYTTLMEWAFPAPAGADRRNLRIWNVLSGDGVLLQPFQSIVPVHAFAEQGGVTQRTDTIAGVGPVTWYDQQWVTANHMAVDNLGITDGVARYQTTCQELGGVCAD